MRGREGGRKERKEEKQIDQIIPLSVTFQSKTYI